METESVSRELSMESRLDAASTPLDRWIIRNATVIRRLIRKPSGNTLQVPSEVKPETLNQSHVRISAHGITHQLTGAVFRTQDQILKLLANLNASSPGA